MRGGFGREVHLQLVLRPFLPITLYLEPPRVVYYKGFLFRHIIQTFHISAPVGKHNCLAIGKHLFTISKPEQTPLMRELVLSVMRLRKYNWGRFIFRDW
jgi:hypothetical protein